jgi:uncharacterized RDD family membrane protein YckC
MASVVVTVCSACGAVKSAGTLSCPRCNGRSDTQASGTRRGPRAEVIAPTDADASASQTISTISSQSISIQSISGQDISIQTSSSQSTRQEQGKEQAKEYVYASIWRRFCAAVFDVLLAAAILSPATILLLWVMEAYHSEIGLSEYKSRTAVGTAAVLLWIVCFGLYCASAESSVHQATPGKRLLKLKVVSTSHGRLSFHQASWRYYAKFLSTFALLVGFAIAFFHSRKQSLHDMIAGTLVVRSE